MWRVFNQIGMGSVRTCEYVSAVVALIIISSIFLQVLLRYVFKVSILGTEEIATNAVIWLWFITMAYATYRRGHVASTSPLRKYPSVNNIFGMIKTCLCIVIAVAFCIFMCQYCVWTYQQGFSSVALRFPLIIGVIVAPIGLGLMAIYLIAELIGWIRVLGAKP